MTDLNNGVVLDATSVGSGTGNYDSFLRLQANGTEEGFNTDEPSDILDIKTSFTDSLKFGTIQKITINGIDYIEFRLDLNESNSGSNAQIRLNDLKIYISGAPATLANFDNGTDTFGAGFTQVFDLSQPQTLFDTNSGSGTDDYRVLVPVSLFEAAGVTDASYVTLYSNLGGSGANASNGGFEEWRVRSKPAEPEPAITIDKSGPATIAEGGATATYTFVITASSANATTDPLTIDTIVDNVFGNLTTAALSANGGNPIVLDPGESFTFTFTSPVILQNAGTTHTNVVTVTAHEDENTVVTDNDDHVIAVTDTDPDIKVVKTADKTTIAEGVAASIVYTYAVTNESAASTDPLKVLSLLDDNATSGDTSDDFAPSYVAGDTDGDGLIDQGETWLYTATVDNVVLNANETRTNIVEVSGEDDEGNAVSDTDDATVTGVDTDPDIKVVKTAKQTTIAEGVATGVIYNYVVTNESAASTDPLKVLSLLDDNATPGDTGDDFTPNYVTGDDNGNALLDKGETWLYTAKVQGVVLNANETRTNIVEVSAEDDEGNAVSDTDDATVTGIDTDPDVKVVKTADKTTIAEGVAASIVYTYAVTNESAASTDPLKVLSLLDDNATSGDTSDDFAPSYVSGDTDGDGLIDQGETWLYAATVDNVVLNAGETRTNIVEVSAEDDEGNAVSDTNDATVAGIDTDPDVKVVKSADKTTIAEGVAASIVYTYAVTNESVASTDPLKVLSLLDDNATSGDTSDDFAPSYVSGDTDGDGLIDKGETWLYTATVDNVVLNANEARTNTVEVIAKDDEANIVSDTDDATVTGKDIAPAIHIEKTVSPGMVQAGSASVTYSYAVTNTSPAGAYDPLSNIVLKDDNGTVGNTADDFAPTYVSGDNGDGILQVGETWLYTATRNVSLKPGGSLTNIVTATGADDEGNKASDTDDATVTAFAGPGVRTPGFWSNLGQQFWDGNTTNQTKSGANFPGGELTYVVDSNKSGGITGADVRALLLGDTNKNGLTDAGENTLLISLADAKSLINASEKQQQDGRYMLARDAVATWLNFLAGNPSTDGDNATVDPAHLLGDAINWLNKTTGSDGDFELTELTTQTKVATSSATWQSPFAGIDHSAATLHTELDKYNNTGKVFGVQFANDGDLVV